jgi:hypothetical protein
VHTENTGGGGLPREPAFTLQVDWLKTRSKQYIPAIYVRPINHDASTLTLLFGHGNGE